VGNLIWILLEIHCSLQQWKNFANRSRIDKVIAMDRVAPFFTTFLYFKGLYLVWEYGPVKATAMFVEMVSQWLRWSWWWWAVESASQVKSAVLNGINSDGYLKGFWGAATTEDRDRASTRPRWSSEHHGQGRWRLTLEKWTRSVSFLFTEQLIGLGIFFPKF